MSIRINISRTWTRWQATSKQVILRNRLQNLFLSITHTHTSCTLASFTLENYLIFLQEQTCQSKILNWRFVDTGFLQEKTKQNTCSNISLSLPLNKIDPTKRMPHTQKDTKSGPSVEILIQKSTLQDLVATAVPPKVDWKIDQRSSGVAREATPRSWWKGGFFVEMKTL